jgi:hypothetical protein
VNGLLVGIKTKGLDESEGMIGYLECSGVRLYR